MRGHPGDRSFGCFDIYNPVKIIDISIKLVIIEYENNFRDGGCHGKAAVSDGYHQYQVRQFF